MKRFAGWDRIEITDGSQTATIRVFGNDGTSLLNEIIDNETPQSLVYAGERYDLSVTFFDTDDLSILQEFEALYTPVTMRIYGQDSEIQWEEFVSIELQDNIYPDKRTGLNTYTMTAEIISDKPRIYFAVPSLGGIGIWGIGNNFQIG